MIAICEVGGDHLIRESSKAVYKCESLGQVTYIRMTA